MPGLSEDSREAPYDVRVTSVDAGLPIEVLGSRTCEDTAITRSRLRALGVAFADVDVDDEPAAATRVAELNGGRRITPTVVFGHGRSVVAEPTLERLGELLVASGHPHEPPTATEFHGDAVTRPIPLRRVVTIDDTAFSLGALRGRRQVALLLAHGADCLACFGYARQLAAQGPALEDADATPVVVVSGSAGEAATWREGVGESALLVGDPDGRWKAAVAAAIGRSPTDALLLVLDRYLAPRAGSFAPEAGGLIAPSEVVEWLRFVALDCPECSTELGWAVEEAR